MVHTTYYRSPGKLCTDKATHATLPSFAMIPLSVSPREYTDSLCRPIRDNQQSQQCKNILVFRLDENVKDVIKQSSN